MLFAGFVRNGIYQIGTCTCEVPFAIICGSCDHAGDFPLQSRLAEYLHFLVLQACLMRFRMCLTSVNEMVLQVNGSRLCTDISHRRAVCDQASHPLQLEEISYMYLCFGFVIHIDGW